MTIEEWAAQGPSREEVVHLLMDRWMSMVADGFCDLCHLDVSDDCCWDCHIRYRCCVGEDEA